MQNKVFTDLSYLREFSGNDDEFVGGMVLTFIQNCPSEMEQLSTAVAAADYPLVKAIVHKLKSSVSFMGIHSLKEAVKEAEDLSITGTNQERIAELVSLIIANCRLAIEELKTQFNL